MFGKPIALATREDLDRLVQDGVPEGRHLEYKETVPVSAEQQKAQRKSSELIEDKFVDRSVASGSGIGDYGRNKLLEELVAFANADGGVIVLGLSETKNSPPRAKAIEAVPHALKLERRLLDQIVDQIEPRLPYASVKTIPINDNGSGVLLFETTRSALGPHWVRASRTATIRREDKCVPLSMPEIHDMVLRNARRFDEVRLRLSESRTEFRDRFVKTGADLLKDASHIKNIEHLEHWFASNQNKKLFGVRIIIVPHQDLGQWTAFGGRY